MSEAVDDRKLTDVRLYGDVSGRERDARVALETLKPKDDTDEAKQRAAELRIQLEAEVEGYEEARKRMAAELQRQMGELGIETAQDMMDLGCTGLASKGIAPEKIMAIRLAFGGSGIPIPCFVPPDLYCLAHGTIGGLQDNQVTLHAEHVAGISRPLEGKEKAHMELVTAARHTRGPGRSVDAMEQLTGYKAPPDMPIVEDEEEPPFLTEPVTAPTVSPEALAAVTPPEQTPVTAVRGVTETVHIALPTDIDEVLKVLGYALAYGAGPAIEALLKDLANDHVMKPRSLSVLFDLIGRGADAPASFKCDEHIETHWECRFCIAAAIATGALKPQLVLLPVDEGDRALFEDAVMPESHEALLDNVKTLNEHGSDAAAVFVKAAVWRRRFTRD